MKFQIKFKQTIQQYSFNIDFLNKEQAQIESLVARIEDHTEKTVEKIEKLNGNLNEILKNYDPIMISI